MTQEQRAQLKIDAVHYDDYRLSEVKLSTGDIIPVETAIALVDNSLINGYSTGTTAYGGKTLRSKPATSKEAKTRMRDLPRFWTNSEELSSEYINYFLNLVDFSIVQHV